MQVTRHKAGTSLVTSLLALLAILWLAGCGGASASLVPGNGMDGSNSGNTVSDVRALPLGTTIPALPSELAAAGRSSSFLGELGLREYLGSGPALLNYSGGVVDGDSLVLTSSADEEAWAIYRASDLYGLWVSTFGVLTVPDSYDTKYYVALGNFTKHTWDWLIETTLPEVDYDLTENQFRVVSPLGNMYWVVAVPPGGHSVEIQKAQLLVDEFPGGGDPWPPGGGNFLFASEGLPGYVELQWGGMDGAGEYELYRRNPHTDPFFGDPADPGSGADEFELLAVTVEPCYVDFEVNYWVPYEYKVRAVNDNGHGEFSEIAVGWAADPNGGGDPPGGDPGDAGACGVIHDIGVDYLQIITDANDFQPNIDFILTPDTCYIAADGSFVDREYFSAGMRVCVDAHFDEGGFRIADAVFEDQDGEPRVEQFAVGAITLLNDGALQIEDAETGVWLDFYFDANTYWFDIDGNEVSPDAFSVGDMVGVTYMADPLTGNYALAVQAYGGGEPGPGSGTIIGEIINIEDGVLDVNSDPGMAYHFITTPDTLWFDENGFELSPADFGVGDIVTVSFSESPDGVLYALVVILGANAPGER